MSSKSLLHLDVLLPEWLIGGTASTMACGASISSMLLWLVVTAECGASNALISVGRLLDNNLLVRRLAGAAANGNEPEEARGNGEADADPENGHHLAAERGHNVVGLEHRVKDTGERGVDGDGQTGGGDDEDGLSLKS